MTGGILGVRRTVPTAVRFAAVGAGGVAVNTLALQFLHGVADVPLLAASALSVELAIAHNYVLNDRWTFGRRRLSLARFTKFNASAVVTLLVNVLVVWVLASVGVHYLVANFVGIIAGAALNFGASMRWVWHGGGP